MCVCICLFYKKNKGKPGSELLGHPLARGKGFKTWGVFPPKFSLSPSRFLPLSLPLPLFGSYGEGTHTHTHKHTQKTIIHVVF